MDLRRRQLLTHGLAVLASAGLAPRFLNAQTPQVAARASNVQQPSWPLEWTAGELQFHADFDPRLQYSSWDQLQSLSTELARILGIKIKPEPIHVILFQRHGDYQDYVSRYFPSVPARRALFIKRRGPGMVFAYDHRQLEVDLRHELTHAYLNASLEYVPLWLDEGLAEFFEVSRDGQPVAHEHLHWVKLDVLIRRVPKVTDLEAIGDLADMQSADYRAAWSWVNFLLNESEQSREVLRRFLQDIESGLPPGPLSRRIAAEIPDADQRFIAFYR